MVAVVREEVVRAEALQGEAYAEVVKLVVHAATGAERSGGPQARMVQEVDAVAGVVEAKMVVAVGKVMLEVAIVVVGGKAVGGRVAVASVAGTMVGILEAEWQAASTEAVAAHLGYLQAAEGWEAASTAGVGAVEGERMDAGTVAVGAGWVKGHRASGRHRVYQGGVLGGDYALQRCWDRRWWRRRQPHQASEGIPVTFY